MLLILFFIAILSNLFLQSWTPVQLFFPLLAIAALRSSRIKALWLAASSGLFLDLLGAHGSLGLHASVFTVVTLFLYSYRRYFFEEKWLAFTLYAGIFGSLSTFLIAFAITCQSPRFNWGLDFIAIDILLLPICDACLGWIIFVAPKVAVRLLKQLITQWHWRTN